MSASNKPPRFTPEESRLLDGRLPDAESRRLARQIAATPAHRDAVAREQRAIDLWAEDAQRPVLSDEVLADRVLQRIADDHDRGAEPGTTGGWAWGEVLSPRRAVAYASAALVLISVGLAGTWLVRSRVQDAVASPRSAGDEPPATAHDPDLDLIDGVYTAVTQRLIRAPRAEGPQGVATQAEPGADKPERARDPSEAAR